jgi:hypothetical protein
MMDINELSEYWLELKEAEKQATDKRREVEDKINSLLGLPENLDGTQNFDLESGYKIKVVGRMTRKVDSDKLQELAAEHGLTDHLSSLFRWTPEINAAVWKATSEYITEPLLGAITTKPARPSFTIIKE